MQWELLKSKAHESQVLEERLCMGRGMQVHGKLLSTCTWHCTSTVENRSGEQGSKKGSTYPDVYFGPIILLPFKELWSGIGRAATPRLQQLPRSEKVAEAEV